MYRLFNRASAPATCHCVEESGKACRRYKHTDTPALNVNVCTCCRKLTADDDGRNDDGTDDVGRTFTSLAHQAGSFTISVLCGNVKVFVVCALRVGPSLSTAIITDYLLRTTYPFMLAVCVCHPWCWKSNRESHNCKRARAQANNDDAHSHALAKALARKLMSPHVAGVCVYNIVSSVITETFRCAMSEGAPDHRPVSAFQNARSKRCAC